MGIAGESSRYDWHPRWARRVNIVGAEECYKGYGG